VALADEYDGFLIDLDGVVWVGRELIPGAAEALTELTERGSDFVFVTNNPGRPASVYAARLGEAGVEVGEQRIVTAGESTARLAAELAGQGAGAFVIGADAFHRSVADAGLDLREGEPGREADVVIVSGHRGFDYEELLTATLALQGGAKLVATSRDPTLPMPGGAWPGTGSILAAVETAGGATAEIGGKPEHHLFDLACERLGADAGRVAMVGDRVASDIEGGRRAGLDTVLVLSGATARGDEKAAAAADHVIDDLAGLLR
jgi:4-nitrophenyl phosphatase